MQNLLVRPQVIIRPSGSLNGAIAAEFQSQLAAAVLSEQSSALLIDLSQVDAIDSAGLMALVSALNLAKANDKQLSLCSVSWSIRIIFELTQLDGVFQIFEDCSAFDRGVA